MTVNYQFPEHLSRVRAWDRRRGQSVEVLRRNWDNPSNENWAYVTPSQQPSYFARRADLDFRYFGESPVADWGWRRHQAKRVAADRRRLWQSTNAAPDSKVAADLRDLPEDSWGHRVARSELRRREAARAAGYPRRDDAGQTYLRYPGLKIPTLRADQDEWRRRRAAEHSREREQAFNADRAARLNYGPGQRPAPAEPCQSCGGQERTPEGLCALCEAASYGQ